MNGLKDLVSLYELRAGFLVEMIGDGVVSPPVGPVDGTSFSTPVPLWTPGTVPSQPTTPSL